MASKRPARATKSKPTKPADIRVPVDATLKKRWDELKKVIDSAKSRGASDWDALWEAAAAIVEHEPPLFVVGGYKNDREFFDEVLGEKARNAYRNIRVAKFASPREETRYGVAKLDAALAYIEAKIGAPLVEPPLPIAFDRLRIGKRRLTLENARREDVEAATRELTKKHAEPTSSAERAAREAFAKHPALKDVRVRVRNGLVTFTSVPAGGMEAFRATLAKVSWTKA